MGARYYAIRRFMPYQGVIQVVDTGLGQAYSTDGERWKMRLAPALNVHWRHPYAPRDLPPQPPTEQEAYRELAAAVDARPPLPFPLEDRVELWLLAKDTLKPLALVKTRRRLEEIDMPTDPGWMPCLRSEQGFRSPALEAEQARAHPQAQHPRARDVLERQVNRAARPYPVLQWFERQPDGRGIGHQGLRVDKGLLGRELAAEDFPELLVAEEWPDALEAALVRDYHRWLAPALLAHGGLSAERRRWLEQAAFEQPEQVARHHHMYPEVLDEEGLQVALVSARLMESR